MKNLMKRCKIMSRIFFRTRMFHGLGLALLLSVLVGCVEKEVVVVAAAKEGRDEVQKPKCDLERLQASRKFVAEAWAVPDSKFNFGEPLSFQMRVSSPSYTTVFHVSTSCKVTRLLYNAPMKAGEIVDFPLRNSGIRITVKPPVGKEAFYIIATRKKLEFLAGADILRAQGSGIARIDLNTTQFYERVKQFRDRVNPDELSITTLKISILANPN